MLVKSLAAIVIIVVLRLLFLPNTQTAKIAATRTQHNNNVRQLNIIPKVGFALEQTLRGATLTVFSYVDFKLTSAYYSTSS
jgi:competence protein ComGC